MQYVYLYLIGFRKEMLFILKGNILHKVGHKCDICVVDTCRTMLCIGFCQYIYWIHGNTYLSYYIVNARGVRITIFFFVAFFDKSYFPCKLCILLELHWIALWYESLVLLNTYCAGHMIFSWSWDHEHIHIDYNTVQYYQSITQSYCSPINI